MKTTKTADNERDAIKEYLQQYHTARRMKRILERRHEALMRELRSPGPGSSAFRATPPSHNGQTDGAVSVVFRIAEVEERIENQREEMAKAVLRVMDMIDLLPQNSMERTVVELRHIDCKGWEQIAREVYMSRSAVFNYYNAALDLLLSYKRAGKLAEEYTKKNAKS